MHNNSCVHTDRHKLCPMNHTSLLFGSEPCGWQFVQPCGRDSSFFMSGSPLDHWPDPQGLWQLLSAPGHHGPLVCTHASCCSPVNPGCAPTPPMAHASSCLAHGVCAPSLQAHAGLCSPVDPGSAPHPPDLTQAESASQALCLMPVRTCHTRSPGLTP